MKRSTALVPLFGVLSSIFIISCSKNDQTFTAEEKLATEAGNTSNASNSRFIKDAYIVVLKNEVSDVDAEADQITKGLGTKPKFIYKHALKGFTANFPAAAIESLKKHPRISYLEQDQEATASFTQTGATWGIDRTDQLSLPLDGTYTYEQNGATVDAYIFDTGIRQDHTEFGGRAKPGFDAILAGGTANDGNGHGTHVAGTVGGATYGLAKNVTLYAVKVLGDNGSGSYSGVIAGIDWAIAHHTTRPAVGNMSLGGGASTAMDDAVRRAIADGIVMCVAAGNDYMNAANYSPARTAEAITVGATTSTDGFASYSNFGSIVDILAPGSAIKSASYTGITATATLSGTSMATPHVAGAAVMYLEAFPGSSATDVQNGLKSKATANKISAVPTGTPNILLYAKFSTVTPQVPEAPALSSPLNGATGTTTNPTLAWIASTGAAGYLVQVSTTPDFSTFTYNGSVTVTSVSLNGLTNGTTYFWRVNASNSAGTSTWSETRSFTTTAAISLIAPSLLSPANGATNVSLTPTLNWSTVAGSTSYDVQVSTRSNFATIVVNRTSITTTSTSLSGLKRNTNYYWRVRASNGTSSSAWSAARSFKTVR